MSDNDLVCDLVIDAVVEWLGKKYRKSQIKLELAEINGGKRLDPWVVERIISLARKKIRDIYHIDPIEFKGTSIEFYQSIIRHPKYSIKYKLIAQARIDALLGLEHLSSDDPTVYAAKVTEALKAMDKSVTGEESNQESTSQFQSEESSQKEKHDDPFDEVHDEKLTEALKVVKLTDKGSLKSEKGNLLVEDVE